MEILDTTPALAEKIKNIFKASNKRKVIIVAFIGSKSEYYLPNVKGVEIYCWPKPGGTNPDTIKHLISHGAKVHFADRVHMKLYWTEDQGSVITSANLSVSALGSNGLKELGVFIDDSSIINIAEIINSINATKVTTKSLKKLEISHHKFSKSFLSKTTTKKLNFVKWMGQGEIRTPFSLGWYYTDDDAKLSKNAKKEARSNFGNEEMEHWHCVTKGAAKYANKFPWVLQFSVESSKNKKELKYKDIKISSWFYTEFTVEVSEHDKIAYCKEWPFQIVQAKSLNMIPHQPPFDEEDIKFKKAF
ncbi:MAG: phospholipase D-like domain-containing protein [Deltaproteobacteria bacterium]|nr:phospholipase D-like domain-containing protein [Deltaproteobacteria bacterium]